MKRAATFICWLLIHWIGKLHTCTFKKIYGLPYLTYLMLLFYIHHLLLALKITVAAKNWTVSLLLLLTCRSKNIPHLLSDPPADVNNIHYHHYLGQ